MTLQEGEGQWQRGQWVWVGGEETGTDGQLYYWSDLVSTKYFQVRDPPYKKIAPKQAHFDG